MRSSSQKRTSHATMTSSSPTKEMEVFLDEEQCNELTAALLFQCNISMELSLPHVTTEKLIAYVNKFNAAPLVQYLVQHFPLLRSFCALGLPLEGRSYNILIYAIIAKRDDIFGLMLELGANVNAVLDGDFTPLHFATLYNRMDYVQDLLAMGADCNIVSKKGKSVLGIAVRRKNITQIILFCRHGALVSKEMCEKADSLYDFLVNIRRAQKIRRSSGVDMLSDIIARYEEED